MKHFWIAAIAATMLVTAPLAPMSKALAETKLTTATVNAVGSLSNRMGNKFRDLVAAADSSLAINHVEGTVLAMRQVMTRRSGAVDIVTDAAWVRFHLTSLCELGCLQQHGSPDAFQKRSVWQDR